MNKFSGFDKKNYSSAVVDISSGDAYQQNIVGGLYLPFEPNNPWLTFDGRYLSVYCVYNTCDVNSCFSS